MQLKRIEKGVDNVPEDLLEVIRIDHNHDEWHEGRIEKSL